MDTQKAISILNMTEAQLSAYSNAMGLITYDASTVGPTGGASSRSDTIAVLSAAAYSISMNPEFLEALEVLKANADVLDPITQKRVEKQCRNMDRMRNIPKAEYIANVRLISEADAVWHTCKNTSDFATFLPYLEKIFANAKRFAGYIAPEQDPYEVYLDNCERGLTRKTADAFFDTVKQALIPLIKKVSEAEQIDDSFLHRVYPVDEQKKLMDVLYDVLQVDKTHCSWGETEHPFTTSFSKYDVRVTTHFYERNLSFAISSTEHEIGHAQYELNCGDTLYNTSLQGGTSMAMHECSSRFFENMIGRNRAFMTALMPKIRAVFPEQLADVSDEDFYRACNRSETSLIRIRADELTYALHIIIRYEIEKMYFDGTLECKNFPAKWNELYEKYLGVTVTNDSEGVLQDSHWATGLIGYFPSYALGSAYAAQIYDAMKQHFDVDAALENGDIAPICAYFNENLWQYGGSISAADAIVKLCGEPFDPSHYVAYLTRKYSELYGI